MLYVIAPVYMNSAAIVSSDLLITLNVITLLMIANAVTALTN